MPPIGNAQFLVALVGLVGVVIGGLISFGISFINRRFDDRRYLRELAVNAAIRFWEKNADLALHQSQVTSEDQYIVPLHAVIVDVLLVGQLLSKKRICRETIVDELARIRSISDAVAEATKPKQSDHRNQKHSGS